MRKSEAEIKAEAEALARSCKDPSRAASEINAWVDLLPRICGYAPAAAQELVEVLQARHDALWSIRGHEIDPLPISAEDLAAAFNAPSATQNT